MNKFSRGQERERSYQQRVPLHLALIPFIGWTMGLTSAFACDGVTATENAFDLVSEFDSLAGTPPKMTYKMSVTKWKVGHLRGRN